MILEHAQPVLYIFAYPLFAACSELPEFLILPIDNQILGAYS